MQIKTAFFYFQKKILSGNHLFTWWNLHSSAHACWYLIWSKRWSGLELLWKQKSWNIDRRSWCLKQFKCIGTLNCNYIQKSPYVCFCTTLKVCLIAACILVIYELRLSIQRESSHPLPTICPVSQCKWCYWDTTDTLRMDTK